MIQCPACRISYVDNTIFCTECGIYLLQIDGLGTDPLETGEIRWVGERDRSQAAEADSPDSEWLAIRLRIGNSQSPPSRRFLQQSSLFKVAARGKSRERSGWGSQRAGGRATGRELEFRLAKPVRLGRIDPTQDIYPEVDLTVDQGLEHGVSREHACIFRRGNVIEVEDLASTNGTLLNGERLSPYLSVQLKDGDQLHLGKLLIQVSIEAKYSEKSTTGNLLPQALPA